MVKSLDNSHLKGGAGGGGAPKEGFVAFLAYINGPNYFPNSLSYKQRA